VKVHTAVAAAVDARRRPEDVRDTAEAFLKDHLVPTRAA
jgi:hypothetical protein